MARPGRAAMLAGVAALSALSACGHIPRAEAERFCADRFRSTPWISGNVKAGVSSGDLSQGYEVDFRPGVDLGDPNAGYTACVQRKSGAYPSRPLHEMGG